MPRRSRSVDVTPVLVLNPRSDDEFVGFALSIVTGDVDDPATFQLHLRERYPRAIVRQRELASEPFVIWYCYRDGRWVGPERAGSDEEGA